MYDRENLTNGSTKSTNKKRSFPLFILTIIIMNTIYLLLRIISHISAVLMYFNALRAEANGAVISPPAEVQRLLIQQNIIWIAVSILFVAVNVTAVIIYIRLYKKIKS